MLLSVGTFLTATTEFVIAGLLPDLAAELDVSLGRAGLLITAFAAGMIVGAPVIAIATARVPQRSTLVGALLLFSTGHVVAAISSSFAIVLVARVVTALATGTFLAVAAAVAVAAVGAANGARAMGTLMSGVALATVVGVPLGSWVGQLVGWRGVLWGLAVVSALAAVVIARLVPHSKQEGTPSLREQADILSDGGFGSSSQPRHLSPAASWPPSATSHRCSRSALACPIMPCHWSWSASESGL